MVGIVTNFGVFPCANRIEALNPNNVIKMIPKLVVIFICFISIWLLLFNVWCWSHLHLKDATSNNLLVGDPKSV